MSFWIRMGDSLRNGTILGVLLGASIAWGNHVYSWLLINVPALWISTVPLWAWFIGIGGIAGYLIDRH